MHTFLSYHTGGGRECGFGEERSDNRVFAAVVVAVTAMMAERGREEMKV